jgi:hypothetical protein
MTKLFQNNTTYLTVHPLLYLIQIMGHPFGNNVSHFKSCHKIWNTTDLEIPACLVIYCYIYYYFSVSLWTCSVLYHWYVLLQFDDLIVSKLDSGQCTPPLSCATDITNVTWTVSALWKCKPSWGTIRTKRTLDSRYSQVFHTPNLMWATL